MVQPWVYRLLHNVLGGASLSHLAVWVFGALFFPLMVSMRLCSSPYLKLSINHALLSYLNLVLLLYTGALSLVLPSNHFSLIWLLRCHQSEAIVLQVHFNGVLGVLKYWVCPFILMHYFVGSFSSHKKAANSLYERVFPELQAQFKVPGGLAGLSYS